MAEFYLGQPVLCVNDEFRNKKWRSHHVVFPIKGRVYRIRAVYDPIIVDDKTHRSMSLVLLHGINNATVRWKNGMTSEIAFWEARFVPATDIDSLRSISDNIDRFMGSNGPRVDKKIKTKRRKKERV